MASTRAPLTPVRWPAEAIWESVAPALPGFTVEVLPEVDSTNSELMRRARAGRLEPVLLVAEQQTAGRGRMGRPWLSGGVDRAAHPVARVGAMPALTFSLGLNLAPADWSGLSLAVGLSVAQSLHPDIRLKWPNDLWWHDRKLAGILIETANWGEAGSGRYVVIGVGLNLQTPNGAGLSTAPVGLAELLPEVDAAEALLRLVAPLVQTVQRFEAQGFAPFQKDFNTRDAMAQLPVTLSDGVQGVAQGVDATGALLVRSGQGVQRITSAEVSVRPQRGPDHDSF
ncbi:MAG TPA: biotin--[acetyl-CoA-carboxylase] ligase [Rhodoferax sp.]|nr:biotin--[acetyl-CoA-carboxylase] ligase [Rhodoferax sp.]